MASWPWQSDSIVATVRQSFEFGRIKFLAQR